jgi:hypothetical protein
MGLKCRILSITIAETTRSKFKRRATSKLKSLFGSTKEKALRVQKTAGWGNFVIFT